MADRSHLHILAQGVEAWNSWRKQNPSTVPNLTGASFYGKNLSGANLYGANLHQANLEAANLLGVHLYKANLYGANLIGANLRQANLTGADLRTANLYGADLSGAILPRADLSDARLFEAKLPNALLSGANLSRAILWNADLYKARLGRAELSGANLSWADLSGAILLDANLSGADLRCCTLVKTNLKRTTLEGCRIYGISAWSLNLEGAKQWNLNVSDVEEPNILVDNLEVAQFIYLLLNNERIRRVIDTITSKVVLILGRFTQERIIVLRAIRDSLRQRGYLPVLFDFDKPSSRDITETISTLAHMARFIIADITEAKSIPQELQTIVPDLPSVPVQPLLLTTDREYGMFEHFRRYPWVLETFYYDNLDEVLACIEDKVISPAEAKTRELSK